MNEKNESLRKILKKSILPALGCTEPIAVALAAAAAYARIGGEILRIHVTVDKNVYKNALRVTIPGTSERGLEIAAALGALC